MKVINKKMCVVCLLVILEIGSLFLMYKSNSKKEIKLDNVENKEVINNGLAIMIEQSNGSYSEGSWPSDTTYVLNPLKSGCVDNDGNKVKDGMTFDKANRKIIVSTNKTSNCYAYFTRSAKYKVEHASSVWNSDLSNDGYRYYGDGTTKDSSTDPKNYVCFGTQSKSECVSDTDKYMYRIIGMFQEETTSDGYNIVNSSSDYHLKLIKKESLNEKYIWHLDNQTNTAWSQSDLYKGLNGIYFINNLDYSYMQDNFWYSKIMNWKWNAVNTKYDANNTDTSIYYYNETVENVYKDEMRRSSKLSNSVSEYEPIVAKIGLMYASDYALSLGSISKNYNIYDDKTLLKKGWLFIKNSDSNPPNQAEWTIARTSNYGENDSAYAVHGAGILFANYVTGNASVRPSFYLNGDIVICDGTGTSIDPYILG